MDLNANAYSATSQLIADAISHSEHHNETVEIRTPAHRREGIEEELFAECDGHDDNGTFWGDGWKVRLILQG